MTESDIGRRLSALEDSVSSLQEENALLWGIAQECINRGHLDWREDFEYKHPAIVAFEGGFWQSVRDSKGQKPTHMDAATEAESIYWVRVPRMFSSAFDPSKVVTDWGADGDIWVQH